MEQTTIDKAPIYHIQHTIFSAFRWIKKYKLETVILLLIVAIGAFFRLYKISSYMNFLGDEGRDAIVVRKLLLEGHLPLIGPGTSIGNMYLGPLYYYMMAPALFMANYSPVGPAVEIALLGTVTIWLVWFVGRQWFGPASLGAAFLYAISPTIVIYSKSSWNPNIMPFFALICMYSIWKVWQCLEFRWLIVLGISYAFVLQSHYLGLLLLPTLAIFWFLTLLKTKNSKFKMKNFWRYTAYASILFAILMSPLLIFDSRHGWQNFTAMKKFFTERQQTVSIKPWNAFPNFYPQFEKITTRIVGGRVEVVGKWVAVVLLASLAWIFGVYKVRLRKKERLAFILITAWIGLGLLGLSLYKQEIYDHYYGFLMPAPFLLIAGISQHVLKMAKLRGLWLVISGILILAYFNFQNSPLKFSPNYQLQRSMDVARKITEESQGMPLNLAVLAERNYDGAYRYFLNVMAAKVLDIDPQRYKETVASQLFVVCEMEKTKCNPIYSPKTEIANFGWSKVLGEWEVDGVIVYKLGHNLQNTK